MVETDRLFEAQKCPGAGTPEPAVSRDTAMRTNDSRPEKATDSTDSRTTTASPPRVRSDGGQAERTITIETIDGDPAALVTITGMGHTASPAIVAELDSAIRSELGHLIREDK